MNLTNAQLLVIKNNILADSTLNEFWNQANPSAIAYLYNADSTPAFYVWRTSISVDEYRNAIVWNEVDTLTVGKARIWEWLTGRMTLAIAPSKVVVRQGIADTFASNTTTRANLLSIAYRQATRLEAILATGVGTIQSPGTMTFEGSIEWPQINEAMEAV